LRRFCRQGGGEDATAFRDGTTRQLRCFENSEVPGEPSASSTDTRAPRADVRSTWDQAAVAGYDVRDRSQSGPGVRVGFGGEETFEPMRRGGGIHAANLICHHIRHHEKRAAGAVGGLPAVRYGAID